MNPNLVLLLGILYATCTHVSAMLSPSEFTKCNWGEPLAEISNCTKDGCPSDHVCIERRGYKEIEDWNRCCPAGNGPCDERRQTLDRSLADNTPPDCDNDGNYEPRQCNIFFCICSFPNGTRIDGTVNSNQQFGPPHDCDKIVQNLIRERPKCWFGKPLTGVDKCSKQGCPADHVCVQRNLLSNESSEWEGCCPKGKGPCDTEKQIFEPSITDVFPPDCKKDGYFDIVQCDINGCVCTLPNGARTGHSSRFTDRSYCKRIVNDSLNEPPGCNFGKPLSGMPKCTKKGCRSDHVCVTRELILEKKQWEGCCPKGKGSCDIAKQMVDLRMKDSYLPDCHRNGDFKPKQCNPSSQLCVCTLPDGTNVGNEKEEKPRSCERLVKKFTNNRSKYAKCHFGKPLSSLSEISNCTKSGCPDDYICVQRHLERGMWEGCCPKGKGPCDLSKQLTDLHMADASFPDCDKNGNYKPTQCYLFFCKCTFPNGTNIEKSITEDRPPSGHCENIFKYLIKKRPKCWFGKPLKGIDKCSQQGCPADHICVQRHLLTKKPSEWEGCCPKGKGPCDTEKQMFDPSIDDPFLPDCKKDGYFNLVQCDINSCVCTLPNGTTIGHSSRFTDRSYCKRIVNDSLNDI